MIDLGPGLPWPCSEICRDWPPKDILIEAKRSPNQFSTAVAEYTA